jgi:hypothetical protein
LVARLFSGIAGKASDADAELDEVERGSGKKVLGRQESFSWHLQKNLSWLFLKMPEIFVLPDSRIF